MTNYNHGAFDHWYNSDRQAESRSRLASDLSSRDLATQKAKSNDAPLVNACSGSIFARLSGKGCNKTA